MNRENVMEKLNEIFRMIFEEEDLVVNNETTANDIEDWDSLTHLELISAIESEFKIHFKLGEITGFTNVGELCDSIIKHLG